MTSILLFFIALQVILLFIISLHDWVHLPPLTDIRALEKESTTKGRLINSLIFALCVLIPLILTWIYRDGFTKWGLITINLFYGLLSLGTILSWWIPYFFGSPEWHKEHFKEYRNTHHFLPARGNNVIPNTFHVLLHLLIWTCFGLSLYLLIAHWG